MKRKIRHALEIAIPLLGMGIIFLSVLFAPDSLQIQVLLVLFGVLILEAGVWGLTSGILPNERRYLGLRYEGNHFIELVRQLNAAALARKSGDDDGRFRNTLEQMHGTVERMAEVAGVDALETAAVAAEAEAAGREAEPKAEARPTEAAASPARAEAEPTEDAAPARAEAEPAGAPADAKVDGEPEPVEAPAEAEVDGEPEPVEAVAAEAEVEAVNPERKGKRKRKRKRRKQRR